MGKNKTGVLKMGEIKEMKKEDFLRFIIILQELYCEHSKVINADSFNIKFEKGNTGAKKNIRFSLNPYKTPLPLKSFGLVDEVCEKFGVKVEYEHDTFHFSTTINIYDNE
jgi:hypothetical protein